MRILKQGILGSLCLALLLASCNMPIGPRPGGLTRQQLRQTLAALDVMTGTPPPTPTTLPRGATPAPGTPFAFPGLSTPNSAGTPPPPEISGNQVIYIAQPGDTLPAVARRFGVDPAEISAPQALPDQAFLPPGLKLTLPNVAGPAPYTGALLPDSEIIDSPSTVDFDIEGYVKGAAGYLSTYSEPVLGFRETGAQIIRRVAVQNSSNPRLLLAILEFRTHWVLGQGPGSVNPQHPLGINDAGNTGLYRELAIVANQINIGYYGWRAGTLTQIKFQDGATVRLSPGLNAGTVGLQYLFAKLYKQPDWVRIVYGENGFLALHRQMFGDPWRRAAAVEPLFPPGLEQPPLELPFLPGERWSFSGGPHYSWNAGSPWGAIDFSPVTNDPPCAISSAWTTAPAAGLVTRSEHDMLALDMDGDGYEQTGWVIFFLHLADPDRTPAGTQVKLNDPLGHPSCEGGNATGTNVHIARKFNGEWLAADGPLPFVLSGWQVHQGSTIYAGTLTQDGQVVTANPSGPRSTIVVR